MPKLVPIPRPLSPILQTIVADLQRLEALVGGRHMIHVATAMRFLVMHFQNPHEPARRPPRRRRPA